MTTTTYAQVTDLQAFLNIGITKDSDLLTSLLATACLTVDRYCRRTFTVGAAATARLFRPTDLYSFDTQDIASTSGLLIDTDSGFNGTYSLRWASTDYELLPLNGIGDDGRPGWPFTTIDAVGRYTFPVSISRLTRRPPPLKITALWGWAAVPESVKTATLYIAADLYHRKDVRLGIVGTEEFGGMRVSKDCANTSAGLLDLYRSDKVVQF